MVDFSFPRETLEHINEVANRLVVLDHHGTAEANCVGLDFATFDMNKCGAMLAYERMEAEGVLDLFSESSRSMLLRLVQYVQDRDLWLWEMENSKAVNAWLATFPKDLPSWVWILDIFCDADATLMLPQVVKEGEAILRSNNNLVNIVVSQAWRGTALPWMGKPRVTAWIANTPILQSDVGHALVERGDTDCAVMWRRASGGRYFYSIRSRVSGGIEGGTFDTAALASIFGGGGHKAASGFTSDLPPWKLFEEDTDE